MNNKLFTKILITVMGFVFMTSTYAREPLFSFFPYTPTTVTVSENSIDIVRYLVTNKSFKSTFTLSMTSYNNPGILQDLSPGNCSNPFILGPQQSCFLQLTLIGSAIKTNIEGGPKVCTLGLPIQCYSSEIFPLRIIKGSINSFTVGGETTGLLGTLVLVNNGSDPLTLTTNGSFIFSQGLPSGSPYAVTVLNQPANQTCLVNNGTGVIQNQAINNITVICTPTPTATLTISNLNLALFINGISRVLTVTNTGSQTATGLMTIPPAAGWPPGTINLTTCSGNLAPGNSCTITIDPGPTPTFDGGTNPCNSGTGTAPAPSLVQVTSTNANTVASNVAVLDYGCIYNGGYLFAEDDSTPPNTSIGGKVVALTDEGSLVWGTVSGVTAASSFSDGLTNTNALANPVGQYPAAQSCLNKIDQGFSDWYLPAICQIGEDPIGSCPGVPNITDNLVDRGLGNFINSFYWSSTQNYAAAPAFQAFAFNPTSSTRMTSPFGSSRRVRCVRDF
ncbi:MAG: hypothetical protein H0U70_02045 [Tatlockia sp.]|nr:hypothetical protein [Tatlockia sp.]